MSTEFRSDEELGGYLTSFDNVIEDLTDRGIEHEVVQDDTYGRKIVAVQDARASALVRVRNGQLERYTPPLYLGKGHYITYKPVPVIQ